MGKFKEREKVSLSAIVLGIDQKKFDTPIPFYIETSLHHHFMSKHSLNEWYKLDEKDVADFDKTCAFYEEIARAMQDNPFFKYKITN